MSSYIQNYGFAKTIILNDKHDIHNEIKWQGDSEFVSMKLDNNDLRQLFGIQPVEMSLEKRIMNDFDYTPIVLEGALQGDKKRKRKTPYKNKYRKKTRCTKRKR